MDAKSIMSDLDGPRGKPFEQELLEMCTKFHANQTCDLDVMAF